MVDTKYIRNGRLSLYDVAADIKNRKLTGVDINQLMAEPIVQQAFFGDLESLKKPRYKWNNKYLEELCMAPALKCFNREYLLYLDEVANYVSKAKKWKYLAIGTGIVLVIIAAIKLLFAFGFFG